MRLPPLTSGRFVRRVNRFRVTVRVEGETTDAHLPNSGRLLELLTPGRPCWLEPVRSPHRKTGFDLKLVEYAGALVSVDARLPNPLFAEALERDRLTPFRSSTSVEREVPLGGSRVDFRLDVLGDVVWIETKSVTLVEDDVALFPDAPTTRGTRHARELARVVGEGERAAIVFVVQRPDARRLAPHDAADPAFGESLRDAAEAGVDMVAWTCDVSKEDIAMAVQIPVDLT